MTSETAKQKLISNSGQWIYYVVLIISTARVDEINFCRYILCRERWTLHVVIKRKFFFKFIFAVFLPYFMPFLLVTLV